MQWRGRCICELKNFVGILCMYFLRFGIGKLRLLTGENPARKKNVTIFFYFSSYVYIFSDGGVSSLQF